MHSRFESKPTQEQIVANPALGAYLDVLCAPLVATTSPDEHEAIRDEMLSHLLELAAAYEELGNTPEEALRLAMVKFGSARKIGAELQIEHSAELCSARFIEVVGLPLTSLMGGIGAWFALYKLYELYLKLRIFEADCNPMSTPYQMAFALGLVTGGLVWKRKLPLLRSAGLAGVLSAGIILSVAIAWEMNLWHTLPGYTPFPHKSVLAEGAALVAATAASSVGLSGAVGKLFRSLGPNSRRIRAI